MATDTKIIKLVQKHLREGGTPVGSDFNLPELFGDNWNKEYLGESETVFGKRFKAAIDRGSLPEVEWVERNSANLNIYRRVS
ncbi:MAG: DUF1413 domain-containing protein [Burkholderiales bacterium]